MTAEELRRARKESANVAYLTFAKHIKADKLGLFCFFEGKDSPYYITRVKFVFSGNYFPISCSGKEKVLKVFELINHHREYDAFKKAFFIDKDFDPPIANSKVFQTHCHSIENLYTKPAVFAEILKSEFGLSEVDESFKKCVDAYMKLQNDFHQASSLFNAWCACLLQVRNTANINIGVNFGNSIPKGFINVSLEGISTNYDLDAIKTKFPNAMEISQSDLDTKLMEFDLKNKGDVFRGKFELDFMLKILNAIIEDSKSAKLYVDKVIKYNITNSQAISQFSQYAETPEALIEYIKNVIK